MEKLAERDIELRRLHDELAGSTLGTGRLAVVTGPPGSGKTSLLNEFATQAAERGTLVSSAVCSRAEQDRPLGVLAQLFPELSPFTGASENALAIHGQQICSLLDDRGPRCVVIDDVQYADTASLQCLSRFVLGSAPVLLVISTCATHSEFQPELHLRLPLLSVNGVAELLSSLVDEPVAHRLAPACHMASGGNPRLAHALAEDYQASAQHVPCDLVTGDAYRKAVVACLHRGGPDLLRVASALALLGDTEVPLDELLGIEDVSLAVSALADMGLVSYGRFAHPAARTAVLGTLATDVRASLNLRAVRLLHERGAPARLVAEHLIATNHVEDDWVLPVLEEAAEQALEHNELHLAEQCLRLAVRACPDERRRTSLLVGLLRAEWYIDPAIGARHVPDLVTAARRGLLAGWDLMVLIYQSLWFGHVDNVVGLAGIVPRPELEVLRLWSRCFLPSLTTVLGPPADVPPDDLRAQSLLALKEVLSGQADRATIGRLDGLLERCLPTPQPLQPELIAIAALVYAGELGRARSWIDRLLDGAPGRNSPSWEGGFAAQQAEISLRLGRPEEAARWANDSLTCMSPQGWGIAIGRPRAVLVLAALELGDLDEAADQLHHPVPPATYQSLWGLHYVHARGRYHLATGNLHAALGDFLRCGDLMTEWAVDHPGLVPWRASAAEAYRLLGRPDRADAVRARFPASPLTDAERRVAVLAASGHPNRSISRQLHITVSTVEQHLTRTYRKLNVTCREQLADRLQLN
ncbi:AAA family ATPase [Lentzea tibetensis]|uniref:AAA family ATPase n=1 Tax=Lentzea tibetensis TaxID=2591470 RepID=A0A563ESI4_9PSEU|nr:LuxR family transcriptional regulator [Lentzea tibetensis]TWP50610.1 AAA family ATPase [Lentzea tibetensis]